MKKMPYQFKTANSAPEALEVISNNPIDIVITDISMPDMDGFDLLKAIRKQYPEILVIALTAHGDIQNVVQFMKHGGIDYIQKPVSMAEIKIVIQSAKKKLALQKDLQHMNAELVKKNAALELEIIEHKKTQTYLKYAKETAETANQSKTQFLANMSHQLRTPLNGILGYTQILKRAENLIDDQQNAVKTIQQCSDHLLTIINDILDFSAIEAHKLQLIENDFALIHFIQRIAEYGQISTQIKQLSFQCITPPDMPNYVRGDEKRLRQILLHLIDNAIKFTNHGNVIFEVKIIHVTEQTVELSFSVKDTGIGIPDNQLNQIFLPFHQFHGQHDENNKYEGTGLGLSICKRLLELMNSKIQVQSHMNQGSHFYFNLTLDKVITETHNETNDQKTEPFVNSITFNQKNVQLALIPPQKESMDHLYELVLEGDIKGIQQFIHALKQKTTAYNVFCDQVLSYAEKLQISQIEYLIEQLIDI